MAGNIKDNESSKQSFREELKLTSEKTNETSLIREIEALRQENSALRQKLASSSDNKSKRKALKQKKTSRNASITKESLTPKNTENSITLKRFASFQKTSPKGSRSPKLSENKHPAFKSLIPKSPSRTRVIPKSEDLMTTPKSGHKRNNSFTLKSPKLKTARSSSTHSLIYFPLNPSRSRHCPACDHLLSKGYSTKHCSKHGFATSKSPRSLSNRSGHDK